MPDINLTIDGKKVTVPAGTPIVQAAKTIGIDIPVFCYHHKLDPVGACRLCLVDFSPGPPRPQTACTTPVAEGIVVRTQRAMAHRARADILEFELVNHPLDCPVCDKGGECPLQDFTFRHGYPTSRIDGPRLHFKKPIPLSEELALERAPPCAIAPRAPPTRSPGSRSSPSASAAPNRPPRSSSTSRCSRSSAATS